MRRIALNTTVMPGATDSEFFDRADMDPAKAAGHARLTKPESD